MKNVNSLADFTVDEVKGILLLAEKIKKNQSAYAHVLIVRICLFPLAWKSWVVALIIKNGQTVILRLAI